MVRCFTCKVNFTVITEVGDLVYDFCPFCAAVLEESVQETTKKENEMASEQKQSNKRITDRELDAWQTLLSYSETEQNVARRLIDEVRLLREQNTKDFQAYLDQLEKYSQRILELETRESKPDPHWEAVHCPDDKEQGAGFWRVRWSEPDEQGRYLWVAHYGYEAGTELSRESWACHAARRNAYRFNESKRLPWEFPEYAPKSQREKE